MVIHQIEFDPFLEGLRILECLRLGQHCRHMAEASILAVVGMTYTALTKDGRIHSAAGCQDAQKLQKSVVFAVGRGVVTDTARMQRHIHTTISQALSHHLTKSSTSKI